MTKIAPSILSANFAKMEDDIKKVAAGGADYIHCDVMDGIFVPNITFGFQMISDIKKITDVPLDVHLMITQPERYVERFCEAGSDIVTVHAESTPHVHRALQMIKGCGKKCGVVLNPGTPLEACEYVLCDVDMVLLMAVNPGYGGQKFIPQVLDKIAALKKIRDERGYEFEIEIDGGVSVSTAGAIKQAGADVLVAGSAVFCSDDPAGMISKIRDAK